ncbi:MAG: hypothetical protein R2702_07255 [Acidimicrobiales bacterium]
MSTTQVRPFRATDVPAGLEVAGAAEVDGDGDVVGLASPLVLFGPSARDPRLGVTWFDGETLSPDDGGRTIEVDGREVTVLDTGGVIAPTVAVAAPGGGWFAAIGATLEVDELAQIAVAATGGADGVVVDAADLPDGWRRLGEDPSGLFGASAVGALRGAAGPGLRAVLYATPGGGSSSSSSSSASSDRSDASDDQTAPEPVLPTPIRTLTVTSTPGDELALDAARVTAPEVEELTVRGHRALLVEVEIADTSDDPGSPVSSVAVSWLEAPGELVSVSGFGVDRDEVLRAAESVEPIPAGEWRDLVSRSQLGDLPGGAEGSEGEEIARGELADGTAWILRDSTPEAEHPSVQLQVALAADTVSSFGGVGSALGSGSEAALVSFELQEISDRRFAAGGVSDEVAAVEVRTASGEVLDRPDLTALAEIGRGSWFVLEVPADATELVLLDADGATVDATDLVDVTGGEPIEGGGVTPTSIVGSVGEGAGGPADDAVETTIPG